MPFDGKSALSGFIDAKFLVMSANSMAPGAQQKRFAAYLNRLAHAAGHQDRVAPLKSYCTGLLLPGERKSVEPMAARLCPENVRQTHQQYIILFLYLVEYVLLMSLAHISGQSRAAIGSTLLRSPGSSKPVQ